MSGDAGGAGEMSVDALSQRLLRNVYEAVRSLEKYNDEVAPFVRWGQWLLLAGIGLISTIPLFALFRLLAP